MRLLLATLCLALSVPSAAHAVGLLGFETGRTLEPQHLEVGGGLSALDGAYGVFGHGRLGILPRLDARLSVGPVIFDEDIGFDVALGGRFQPLTAADAMVDVAFGAEMSFLKTADVLIFGFDPVAHASRHFGLPGDREIFVGITLGLATSVIDLDGGEDTASAGFLGGLTAGVEIVEDLAFALETRWRDDVWRLGALVTLDL